MGGQSLSPAPGKLELLRLFARERRDPEPFYRALAHHALARFPFPLEGHLVLDLGAGGGWFAEAMTAAGAAVIATDLDFDGVQDVDALRGTSFIADGRRLPAPDGSYDGVFCSNVLEHTPEPVAIVREIARVLAPGGWAYVSWTNWYSPWGGHAIAPLHYLGPDLGLRTWRRLFGAPRGKNLPYENLWVTYIGATLRAVRAMPELELVDAFPRYYPSQRWILTVPGVREVATWNCVLLLRRRVSTNASVA